MKRSAPLRRLGRRAARESGALARFRRVVIARAGGRCQRCRRRCTHLDAHHMVPRARRHGENRHDPDRGRALCFWCHDEVHHFNPPDKGDWILRG